MTLTEITAADPHPDHVALLSAPGSDLTALAGPAATIAGASRGLFERYGYAKTTIGDIAVACDMSAGNLYRFFKNKQAIGFAVVNDFISESAADVNEVLARPFPSVEAQLRAVMTEQILFSVRHLREAPKLIELAAMIFETDDGLELVDRLTEENRLLLQALIQKGVANGEFSTPDPSAAAQALILGTKFFTIPMGLVSLGLDNIESGLGVTLDLLCAGLRRG